jgi:hypothetical protein
MPVQYCIDNELNPSRLKIFKDFSGIKLARNEATFRIKDCQLTALDKSRDYLDPFRYKFFELFTTQVLNYYNLKDLNFDFMVNFNDETSNEYLDDPSKFVFARSKSSPHICVPDSHIGRTIDTCSRLPDLDIEWDTKQDKACFFGSDTGLPLTEELTQRVSICQRYFNSKVVDAKITNFTKTPPNSAYSIDFVSIADQLKYKFILNVNGNTTSWERLIWTMASNSLCIYVRPPVDQNDISWYYHMFDFDQAFVYVDENNIESCVKFLLENKETTAYLKQRQKVTAEILSGAEFHAQYYAGILQQYNKLYNE